MTWQESWCSGKKSGQCVVAGTGHGVIPKYVFVCLAPLQPDEYYNNYKLFLEHHVRSRDLARILEQWKEVWSVCGGWHWSWSDSKVCFCVFGSFTAR